MICYTISLSCAFFMSGCTDFYSGKRPYDYGHAKWVSESPDMWFVVEDPDPMGESPYTDHSYSEPKGEMFVDGKIRPFTVLFSNGNFVTFATDFFSGYCTFSPEKLVVRVDKEIDNVFDGKVDEIVFIKTPIEE